MQITQDGKSVTIGASDMVTPAQLVAVGQALSGGQTINLNASGVAVGGTFTLTNNLAQSISGLNVPSGVTAIQDFASAGLNLAGNFSNYGTFYAVSSSTNVTTAVIQASNIFNQPGALLTSVLPTAGLPGYSNLVANLNLSLIATNNIVNYGSITSSGGIAATAGGSISNLASAGSMPIMQALNDIVMQAASISNAGSILSQAGAVNIATANLNNQALIQSVMQGVDIETRLGDQVLNVLNNNGVVSSLKELSLSANHDLLVEGGQLNGESIKLSAPTGWVMATNVDLVGPLDLCASDAHILASGSLTLRSFNVTGDPIIASPLSQSFFSVTNVSQPLLIVAKGDIDGGGFNIISTSGDIHMFAGADWASVAPNLEINPVGLSGSIINMGNISGKANIVLGAFNGSITTGDVSTDNGSVVILAPTGITTNNISSSGNVTLRTANPVFFSSNGNKLTFDSTGALQDGIVKINGSVLPGNINVSNVSSGAYLELIAGGSVTAAASLSATNVAIQVGDTKSATIGGTVNASTSALVSSVGALVLSNDLTVNTPVLKVNSSTTGSGAVYLMGNIYNSNAVGDIKFATPQLKFTGSNQITTSGIIEVDGPPSLGVKIQVPTGNTGVMNANSIRVILGGGGVQLTGSGTLQLVTSSLAPDASHIEALGSGANISIDANLVTNGNLLIKTNGGSSQVINNKLVDAGGTLQVHTRFLRLSQNSTMQGHGVKVTNNADVDIVGPGTAKTATLQSLGAGNTLSIVPSANNKNITFSGSGGTIILDSDAQVLIGEKPIPTNNVVVSPTVVITGTRATAVTVTTATIGSYFQNGSQITYNSGQLLIDTSTVKFGANSLLKAMTVQILTNNPLVIQASSGNSAIESLVGNVFFQGSTGLQFVTLSGNSTINVIAPSHMFTTLAGDIIVGPNTTLNLVGSPGTANFSAINGAIEVGGKIDTTNSLFFNSMAVNLKNNSYIHAASLNAVAAGTSYLINLDAGTSVIDTTGYVGFLAGSGALTVRRSFGVTDAVLSLTGTSTTRELNGIGATVENNVRIDSNTNLKVNSYGIGGDTTVFGTLNAAGNITVSSAEGTVDFQGKSTATGDVTLTTSGLATGSIINSGDIVSAANIFINSSGFDFDHTGGKLAAAGSITAMVGSGNIDIGADVTAASIALTAQNIHHSNGKFSASGAVILSAMGGDITQSVTAPRVEGGTVTLSALTGSVGVGNVFKTMTPNLDINANGALIDNLGDTKLNYLGGLSNSSFYNDGNITITGAFASGGALSFSANGNINTSGVISNLSDISILSTAAKGSIQIGDGTGPDDILTTGNLTLNATGSGTITTGGLASLNAQQVSLIAPAGAIGTQALPILTSANKLLTDASGDVFLQNSGPVTVLSSRAGTKFDLQNTGKVTVAGGIQAVDTSISTIGIGDIIINTGSPLASSSLTLNVLGFGAISAAMPVAAAPALQLFSAFGDIGSAGNPIDVSASTLTANTLNGSVYILDRQAVNLGSSSAGSIGTFHLIAPGITTTGNVNAQNVLLETPLLNNDFLLQATGTVSILSTTGSLLVQGSGALSSAGPITFSSIASVNVTQTSIQDLAGGPGVVTGNAPGFFSVTSNSGFNASNIAGGAGVKLSSLSGNLNASQITSGGPMDLLTAAGSLTATALSASGNMLLTSAGGDLIVNGKLDANGTILLSSGNGLTLNAPVINSTGVLSLTANNDISINGGVLSTGSISKSVNKLSTNMADFDYSAIVTPGGVTIRSNNGKIATGPVQITSYGASISFAAPGAISIGTGSNLFAQGGNITINSWTDDVMVGGFSTFQAVARSIIPSAPMTIDGQQINQFVGGDIGIDVDINVASQYGSYDNFLRTFDLNRVVNGNVPNGTLNVVGPNINNMAGTTMNITNSGMVDIRTTGTATAIGSISFGNGTKLNTDGGVIQIDPVNSDVVIGPNVAFNAFGPNLLGGGVFILPPPPPAGNNQPIQPPPLPPLFAALPGIIAGGAGGGGGGGGGGAVAGPGAGGPVTPVDVVNPVAQVPVVAPVPPPAIQTDVIVLSTNEEKQQEKKEATFATRSTELDYFVPITYVGTAPCQQFLIAGKRRGDLQCVTVVASRGTVLGTVKSPEEKQSFASRLLSLKEGKIVVVSGQKSGMKLDVSDATLNLPVGSVAVVHRKASGAMRVSMVSGGTVSVAIKGAGGDQVMTAAPGEEIAIGGSEEELIAADGIERQLISAKMIMTVDGDDGKADDMLKGGVSTSAIGTTTASNLKPGKRNLRVEKRSFDREKMSEGENLLACLDCAKIGCSSSMCRLQRTHFTQPKTKTKKLTASSQKQIAEARDAHVFSPVAYKISLQPPTAAPVLSTLQLGTAIVKHAGSAHITSMEKSVITANQGEVLVCSSKPTVVKAGNALVECSPGSLMLINTTPQSISVSSLWQDGAVTVHAGTRNYKMHPGEECIIAGSNQTQKAMQTNAAARRNVRSFSVGASQSMSVSEISLASVFLTSPVLQQLRRSQESVDKNMANRIAKMYAVLNIVTGRRGPYSYSQQ